MLGHELAIEQREVPRLEAGDQPRQRHLGCIARPAEHAFAEEGAAQLHAVKTADQLAALPDLDRMGMT